MIIKHFMSLGICCDSLYFMKKLGDDIRIPGPVDNCAGNPESINYLLNGKFLNDIINENVTYENDGITTLNESKFLITHNDFTSLKFKIGLRHRLLNLFQYIYNSQYDNSLWFVISITSFINNENELYKFINELPLYIKQKLIIIQGRENNYSNIFDNIKEYPVFNIYKDKIDLARITSDDFIKLFNNFLQNNINFYNSLNNSNWSSLQINIINK